MSEGMEKTLPGASRALKPEWDTGLSIEDSGSDTMIASSWQAYRPTITTVVSCILSLFLIDK